MASKKRGISEEAQKIIADYFLIANKMPDSTLKGNPEWEEQLKPYAEFMKAIWPFLDVKPLLFERDKLIPYQKDGIYHI